MWSILALALLSPQDGFTPVDPRTLPFVIGLPPGGVIEKQGVSDYMTYRVRQGPEVILTIRGGISAAPIFGMETQSGPVRQLRNCRDGAVASRSVLLWLPLSDQSLLIGTAPGRTEFADPIIASIRIPGKHDGVRRENLFTCQS
jgi:hypothetical protein